MVVAGKAAHENRRKDEGLRKRKQRGDKRATVGMKCGGGLDGGCPDL